MRLRSVLPNAAVAVVSTIFGAVALEGAARVWVRTRPPVTDQGSVTCYHPLLGWDKPPGADLWLERPEYSVHLQINAHGLRGPDRPYEKPPGVRRVLLLGDSFAEGYTVAEEKTARAVLEGLLNARGGCGRYQVLNGGTSAYSTDQEYLFFSHEGRKYRPDLVVLLFFFNDLYPNTSGDGPGGRPKPYFDLEGDRLVLHNSPVPPPPEGQREQRPTPRPFRLKPWRGSMALRLLSNRTVDSNPPLHRFLARLGLAEPPGREAPPLDFWPYRDPPSEEVLDMRRRVAAILGALKADVESAGGRLAVVYVPSRFEVNDQAWELTRQRYGMGKRWRQDVVARRVRQICEARGIPFLDPSEPLRRAESSRSLAYFPRDGHWTAVGQEIAAGEIAAAAPSLLPCE